MEHVENYRHHHFRAWTEKDGITWKGCFAINGTIETGLGREHKEEEQILKTVIDVVRAKLDALQPEASTGALP